MLTEWLNELLAIFGDYTSTKDQVETGPNNEAKMKFSVVDVSTSFEMSSPGTNDPAIDDQKSVKRDAETYGADN